MNSPLVAVFMVTYNHEKYIAQAIESVLAQKTNFPFNIYIGEDCSTDNTAAICRKYKNDYPDKIELFFNEENIGPKKNAIQIFNACFQSKAKYIAMLEGDDYWIDPFKLQKQVDFLEANEDFAICFHNMDIIYDESRESHLSNPPDQEEVTTIEDLAYGNFIYTASCIFRNGLIKEFPSWFIDGLVGDYVLHMLNAQFGKIRFLDEVMGVYRVHKGSIWEANDHIYRIEKWVELLDLMKNHFIPEVNAILIKSQSDYCTKLIEHYQNNAQKCKKYSNLKLENNPFLIVELTNKIKELNNRNETVINSTTYKIGAFILKPYSFLKRLLDA